SGVDRQRAQPLDRLSARVALPTRRRIAAARRRRASFADEGAMTLHGSRAGLMVLLGLFPMVARADRDEWRLGFTGTGLWTTIDYAGSRASLHTPGCGGRMSFGV